MPAAATAQAAPYPETPRQDAQTQAHDDYNRANEAYWANRAPSYGKLNRNELASPQHDRWQHELDSQIQAAFPERPRTSVRVLDVGTGPGFFAITLAQLGYDVTGVDYTANMLEQARANARQAACRVSFHQMDAQELSFVPGSFDVVVSRNLTWNLYRPECAYAAWARMLAPGGLLLNFDANWYRYLFDDVAKQLHYEDRARVAKGDVFDDIAGTDVNAMEAIARRAPLSQQLRPSWDLALLGSLGLEATADTEAWRRLWTRDELANNASTPMFMIRARKGASGPERRPAL